MFRAVVEMEKVLRQEKDHYEKLYRLEEEKRHAILQRNWAGLESLSKEQSDLFPLIDRLETKREELIDEYRTINGLDDLNREIRLKDIVLSMDEDSSHHLLQLGMELKDMMTRVGDIVKNNNVLINDNREFFNILLSGLKDGVSVRGGYDKSGREEAAARAGALLFNQTA